MNDSFFTKKIIFYGNILSLAYFVLLHLLGQLNVHHVIIGVCVEILTIPFILWSFTAFAVTGLKWKRNSFKSNSFYFIPFLIIAITIPLIFLLFR